MRSKSSLIIFVAGIISGIGFVISCGNQAASIAEQLVKAIDVTFDSSATALSSSTVQDALVEIDERINDLNGDEVAFEKNGTSLSATTVSGAIKEVQTNLQGITPVPEVLDANDEVLGILVGTSAGQTTYPTLDVFNNAASGILQITPVGYIESTHLYFVGVNCLGQAYMPAQLLIQEQGGKLYRGDPSAPGPGTYGSHKEANVCSNGSFSPPYSFAAIEVTSMFPSPIQGPLHFKN